MSGTGSCDSRTAVIGGVDDHRPELKMKSETSDKPERATLAVDRGEK